MHDFAIKEIEDRYDELIRRKDDGVSLDFGIEDGRIIGAISGIIHKNSFLYIGLIFVLSEFRFSGYGTRLMYQIEKRAYELGAKYSFVDTHDYQAGDFYIKLGYEQYGRLYYRDYKDACGPDRVYYKKRLESNSFVDDENIVTMSSEAAAEFENGGLTPFNNDLQPFTQQIQSIHKFVYIKNDLGQVIAGASFVMYYWFIGYVNDIILFQENLDNEAVTIELMQELESEASKLGAKLLHKDLLDFETARIFLDRLHFIATAIINEPDMEEKRWLVAKYL